MLFWLSLVPFYLIYQLRAFLRHLNEAKASGFHYQVSWTGILLPAFLPASLVEAWLLTVEFPSSWHAGYRTFARAGADTFISVSASQNALWTCEPEVILQITRETKDGFPKPVKSMTILNVFGPTVSGTDGDEERLYRRIASAAFNSRTNRMLWGDVLAHVSELVVRWSPDGSATRIRDMKQDVATMTLQIISQICYGRDLDHFSDGRPERQESSCHALSYRQAMFSMLSSIHLISMIPHALLRLLPIPAFRRAWLSFIEWKTYLEEMRDEKALELRTGHAADSPTLIDALVRAAYPVPDPLLDEKRDTHISQEAVLGNLFMFLLAGHETTASTLKFAIYCLACHPKIQQDLQSSLDSLLGDRSPQHWSYETDFPALLEGYTGAIVAETARLFTILPFIRRCTEEHPRTLIIDGKTQTVPPETQIYINTSATHRNPKHWHQASPEPDDPEPYCVSSFDPGRWIGDGVHADGLGCYRPPPGAYVPFSEGPRGCMGKRFAQIEMCATLARIFKDYSVELDTNFEKSDGDQEESAREAWKKTRTKAKKALSDGIGFTVGLEMKGEIPVRLVARGQETFHTVNS